jgi:hypothetical protein
VWGCRLLLGYAHNVCGMPLEQLSLGSLVPSAGREGVSLLMDYQHWRQQQRGTASSTATVAIKAVVHVARFLYHDLAKVCCSNAWLPASLCIIPLDLVEMFCANATALRRQLFPLNILLCRS